MNAALSWASQCGERSGHPLHRRAATTAAATTTTATSRTSTTPWARGASGSTGRCSATGWSAQARSRPPRWRSPRRASSRRRCARGPGSSTSQMAQKRYEGVREMLEYRRTACWTRICGFSSPRELQDLARGYLDMAIYAAFLMERAYELEFDRELNRIRLDYGVGGAEGLLGGDYLKRDISAFTHRLPAARAEEESGAPRPVAARRVPGGVRDVPAAPASCRSAPISRSSTAATPAPTAASSRTSSCSSRDSCRSKGAAVCSPTRRLYRVASRSARHGQAHARDAGGAMVLSSYQFRRDIAVFQPSEEMLGCSKISAPQANWTLELPRSATISTTRPSATSSSSSTSTAKSSDSLRAHVKTFYPNTGGRSMVLSARFDCPTSISALTPIATSLSGWRRTVSATTTKRPR